MKNVRKYDYNMRVPEQNPFESDMDYYRSLARMANNRMTRIENLVASGDKDFGNMDKYAYRNAQYDIRKISGSEAAGRYDYNIPLTKEGRVNKTELQRRINSAKRFLESPTSTKTGLRKVYEKRARTINQRYGWEIGADGKRHRRKDWQNLTWEDMARYYEQDESVMADQKYGSKTEVWALGAIKRISNDPDKIKEAIKGNLKLSNDEAVQKAAQYMLQNGMIPDKILNED